jgi:hypothetical protein
VCVRQKLTSRTLAPETPSSCLVGVPPAPSLSKHSVSANNAACARDESHSCGEATKRESDDELNLGKTQIAESECVLFFL